jgi:ribonuclease HI
MRGIIHDPRGIQIVKYAWGLGNISNNMVESYSLWCGLVIVKEEGIKKMIVLGDSSMVK